jgi:uncharacterized protein YdeI (YjbR/CyaY-like superfamily)
VIIVQKRLRHPADGPLPFKQGQNSERARIFTCPFRDGKSRRGNLGYRIMSKPSRTVIAFQGASDLENWLSQHHDGAAELWVRIYRKGSGQLSVTWMDCVIEAIRFGWIDGQKQPFDDQSFLQRLTPRKPKSNWSAKNCVHAAKLIAENRIAPSGLAQVDAAKADGRWANAYAGSGEMAIPQDFLAALQKMPRAKAFFKTLDRKNLYPIYYRLQTAKRPETRMKRMALILAQLDRCEKFH